MLCMARKNDDVYKSRLWEVKNKLHMKAEELYAAMKPDMTFGNFKNYLYRPLPRWFEEQVDRFYESETRQLQPITSSGWSKLRIFGTVGAGGSPDTQMDEDYLDVPSDFVREDWGAWIVQGDAESMMPFIQPGDTLVIKPSLTVKLNKFNVIRSLQNPTELMVKDSAFDGTQFVFRSLNPKYPNPIKEGYIPVGYVVGIISGDGLVKMGPVETGIDENFIVQQLMSRIITRNFEQ